jgi:hypothetical protein
MLKRKKKEKGKGGAYSAPTPGLDAAKHDFCFDLNVVCNSYASPFQESPQHDTSFADGCLPNSLQALIEWYIKAVGISDGSWKWSGRAVEPDKFKGIPASITYIASAVACPEWPASKHAIGQYVATLS